jgi:methionyl-tRNA formyltransferase
MRILFMGNNWVGWKVLAYLREQGEEIVGIVVHPEKRRQYGEEILRLAQMKPDCLFNGARLRKAETLRAIEALRPDIAVSALFGYILRPTFLELMPAGCVNIHPALLPYNRGAFPNVWSIVEGTPAGVTLHYIDSGIDTGNIIAQREIPVEPIDTGESLYRRLEQGCVEMFRESWPQIRSGVTVDIPQDLGIGTHHFAQDVEEIDEIDLEKKYTARELIDIIRARTFPPYEGAFFRHNGRKIYIRLELYHEEE